MKKIIYILSTVLLAASCSLFEMDNYDGPDASVTGRIIDAKTGENVPLECKYGNFFGGAYFGSPTEGYFSVFEKGWDYEKAQYWHIKYDGSYANSQIFSGTYRIEAAANNFYPVVKDDVVFKKGDNTLDWEVVPYARVIDPKIEYKNAAGEGAFVVGGEVKEEWYSASKKFIPYTDKRFIWPIPQNDLLRNPTLAAQQNAGW